MREGRTLAPGTGQGEVLALDEPLSMWGGLDATSGRIIDVHHPQVDVTVAGKVLVMPAGRGSSSSSSVLAEAIRVGTAPAAIVLGEPDPILALASIVASELYGIAVPVVTVDAETYATCVRADALAVEAQDGTASITAIG